MASAAMARRPESAEANAERNRALTRGLLVREPAAEAELYELIRRIGTWRFVAALREELDDFCADCWLMLTRQIRAGRM